MPRRVPSRRGFPSAEIRANLDSLSLFRQAREQVIDWADDGWARRRYPDSPRGYKMRRILMIRILRIRERWRKNPENGRMKLNGLPFASLYLGEENGK